jgi:Transglycosylase SLT domain
MKKSLFKLHEQAAAKARAQARRDRMNAYKENFVGNHALKKYLTINLSQAIFAKKWVQSMAVVTAFLVTGIAVNEPLRNDLLRQINLSDEFDTASGDTLDLIQPGETGMRPVIFSYPGNRSNAKLNLIEPSVQHFPVPSIAPLANQINNGKIDPQALDSRLLDSAQNQAKIASLMAEKYKVDVNTLKTYISHAVIVGKEVSIDPVLIIAVMAIESNFKATVQSPAGAQGLMQVMTSVHANKFTPYGGVAAAFKPEANIRVGAYILKYFIAQAGSLSGGLRYYVGGAYTGDGGYAAKVMSERNFLLSYLGKSNPQDNNDIESADNNEKPNQTQGLLKFLGVNLTDS